jgi:hypothetical protein
MSSAITTYTGKTVDIFNFWLRDICLEDIAHALSLICRFGGHCSEFYSVAEHCVRAAYIAHFNYDIHPAYILVHDAAEAYIGDLPRPIKRTVFDPEIETKVRNKILNYFKLDVHYWKAHAHIIKEIDDMMLNIEVQDLLSGGLVTTPLGPPIAHSRIFPRRTWQQAKDAFLLAAKNFGLKDYKYV